VQLPTKPTTSQASQAPAQAASQQWPSTQKPLWHWLPPVQPWPLGSSGTQLTPLQ
jgi:hypothetical protein